MAEATAASTEATSNGGGGGGNRSSCSYADAAGRGGGGGGWGVDTLASSRPFSSASASASASETKRTAAGELVSRQQWIGAGEGAVEGSVGKVRWLETLLALTTKTFPVSSCCCCCGSDLSIRCRFVASWMWWFFSLTDKHLFFYM